MIAIGVDPGDKGAVVVLRQLPGQPWSVARAEEWRRWHEAPELIFDALGEIEGLPVACPVLAAVEGIEVIRRDRSLAGALTLAQRAGECLGALRVAMPEVPIYQAPARDWRAALLGVSMSASGDGSLAMLRRALSGRPSAIEADRPELAAMVPAGSEDWAEASEHVVEAAGLALFAAMRLERWLWDRAGSWKARRAKGT